MKSIIQSLWYFVILMRLGYRLSGNTNVSKNKRWGFVRVNHGKDYAIVDIDFDFGNGYSHVHGDCMDGSNKIYNGDIYRYQPK